MMLDDIDRRLLNLMQAEFPFTAEPFAVLGQQTGIEAAEVIRRVEGLKSNGIVRLIGPLFNTRSLGYQTTLVAMKVAEDRLDKAARVISQHPGISHGYQREHDLNIWFTLSSLSGDDMDNEVLRLAGILAAEAVFNLPALRLFKRWTYFDATGGNMPASNTSADYGLLHNNPIDLSPMDRAVINGLQEDLPILARPFDSMSERLGIETDELLACCQALLQRSIMLRYCASVRHTSLGFVGNAMVCWAAPSDTIEGVCHRLTSFSEVSHCYERRSVPNWLYNLYAMIHGHNREACLEIAREVSQQCILNDYVILFSNREFKKTRIKYLV